MGKNKVKIKVDYSKCTQPEDCRKCIGICPPGVFNFVFTDKNYHNPQNWKIIPIFPHLCISSNNCNACVENCPKDAINIRNK